jgi:hypothetical protein
VIECDAFGVIGDTTPAANGPSFVRLIDGREVSTWSDDWRHECEARFLLSLPLERRRCLMYGDWHHVFGTRNDQERRGGIAQKRGQAAVSRLEATMREIWEQRKQRRQAA